MWHTIRIAYFETDKTSLLLGPVRDCVERLRSSPGVAGVMLLSHWKFGPHVDLIVDCAEELFLGDVFPTCRDIIQPWLERNPSTTVLDPQAYEVLSQKVALTEIEPGPYTPLLTNNTVSSATYVPNALLTVPRLAAAKESFLRRTVALSLRLVEQRQRDSEECFLTLTSMMGVVGQSYAAGGLARGFLSFRSHAEYFFAAYDDEAQSLRKRFNALDARLAARIDQGLKSVLADDLARAPLSDALKQVLVEWREVVRETAAEGREIVSESHALLDHDEALPRRAAELAKKIPREYHQTSGPGEHRRMSPVWEAVQQQEGQRVMNSPEFLAYRMTINFFYMLLPTLQVSPTQKFCLCHLVANAAERIFATRWQSLMGVEGAVGDPRG